MKPLSTLVRALLVLGEACLPCDAQQPIRLSDVAEGLPESRADEPKASHFSAEQAAKYLDRALNWQKTKKCATCHTNLFYMAARPRWPRSCRTRARFAASTKITDRSAGR